jgi:N utilization substance protein B
MRERRKAREIALQVLYSLNFVNIDTQDALDLFWGNFVAPKAAKEFAAFLVQGTCEHK